MSRHEPGVAIHDYALRNLHRVTYRQLPYAPPEVLDMVPLISDALAGRPSTLYHFEDGLWVPIFGAEFGQGAQLVLAEGVIEWDGAVERYYAEAGDYLLDMLLSHDRALSPETEETLIVQKVREWIDHLPNDERQMVDLYACKNLKEPTRTLTMSESTLYRKYRRLRAELGLYVETASAGHWNEWCPNRSEMRRTTMSGTRSS